MRFSKSAVHRAVMGLVYSTLDPLDTGGGGTLTGGNLTYIGYSNACSKSTLQITAASKFYFELTVSFAATAGVGIGTLSSSIDNYPGGVGQVAYLSGGNLRWNGNTGYSLPSWVAGTIIGVAIDGSAGTISYYHNGSYVGVWSFSGFGVALPAKVVVGSSGSSSLTVNFGATAFTYPVPSGYTPGLHT